MAISRLFNIDPIGVGTPYVESLPSYIKRLAEAHSVYPRVLLKKEIFPETRDYPLGLALSRDNKILLSISSNITSDLIRVLETKTSNNNIHNMSLSKLNDYITGNFVFRDHAAWCPLCFEESRQKNEPVYEQLIWSIREIEICGKHCIPLHHICPQCHNQIKHYNAFGRVGYCCHCKSRLDLDNLDSYSYNELNKWDVWVLDNIGSILSGIPDSNLFTMTCLSRNIVKILDYTGLTKVALAKEVATTHASIREWAIKGSKPTLSSVLLLGFKYGLPIIKLLFEEVNVKNIKINNSKGRPNTERRKVDYNELQQAIKRALASTELVSIEVICKKFGVKFETLKRHFPREYNLLQQKWKRQKEEKVIEREAQIRDKMRSLKERGIFPSTSRVTKCLGMYGIMNERYRKIWESTIRELGYTDKIGPT